MDFRDKFGSGLPLLYHVTTTTTTVVVGAGGAYIMVIGIMVTAAAAYKCHNPASSHASSYVTRGPRKPYTAACAWLRVFRCGARARATHCLQRSSVIASKRACVRARILYTATGLRRVVPLPVRNGTGAVRGARFALLAWAIPTISRSEYTHTRCTARYNNGLPVGSLLQTRAAVPLIL